MFFTDKYTDSFRQLFAEAKRYIGLQKRYLALETAEKLTILLSAVAIAVVCVILGSIFLLFASFALAYWIGQLINSLALGFLIIAIAILLMLVLFYNKRKKWIILPLAEFMASLFADTIKQEEETK